jgi:hypothetical protein
MTMAPMSSQSQSPSSGPMMSLTMAPIHDESHENDSVHPSSMPSSMLDNASSLSSVSSIMWKDALIYILLPFLISTIVVLVIVLVLMECRSRK